VAIYRSSGNPLLADFVTDLYAFMLDHRRLAVSQPGAIEKSYRDHLAIYEALRKRAPDAVFAAFERHIDRIYATTLEILAHRAQERKTG
jgi:DNA-binding FadR family transcriptional regulator